MSDEHAEPFRMFAADCPFRKNGSPVLGNFGGRVRQVIVMEMAEWNRLCAAVPELQTKIFEVGALS